MGLPNNPKTTVLQNEYYLGLTEEDIWNHYLRYKHRIILEVNKRPIMLFISTDNDELVVKRKLMNGPFTLTEKNYEKILTGRTVSIAVELNSTTSYGVIDIDPGFNVSEVDMKILIEDIIRIKETIMKTIIKDLRIISTGKGYHIYCIFYNAMPVKEAQKIIQKYLSYSFGNSSKITINKKDPKVGKINLDLSIMTTRGAHVVPFALCRNGLMCTDITDRWKTFKRQDAII